MGRWTLQSCHRGRKVSWSIWTWLYYRYSSLGVWGGNIHLYRPSSHNISAESTEEDPSGTEHLCAPR